MQDQILPFITPVSLLLVLVSIFSLDWAIRKRNLRNSIVRYFEGHVNKKVLKQIQVNAPKIKVYGEEKIISMLFLDIRGFTVLSEKYTNRKLVKILNKYLTEISTIILENDGTIDKYMGDAVMAFWGAPLADRQQATKALRTAYEIKQYIDKEKVNIGIGLNTGSVTVGNIGRDDMISYTAIGDSVNLAARLESLNKQYGTNILFSKSTKEKFEKEFWRNKSEIFWREIDKVRVYGRKEVTQVFELIGFKEDLDQRTLDGYEWFDYALQNYRKGNWQEAMGLFRRASRILGSDSVSKTLIKRCKIFEVTPPQGRWTGTISLGK